MQLKISADSTVEYYTVRGPLTHARPRIHSGDLIPVADPIAKLTRECSALRIRLATVERLERRGSTPYVPSPISARTPPSVTLDLALDSAYAQRKAARTHIHGEVMKLAERYNVLEQTLREMQETLRMKDREIDALRKERDRLLAERELNREKSRSPARTPPARTNGADRHQRHRDPSRSRGQVHRTEEPPPVPLGPRMSLDAEHAARARSLDVFLTKTDSWSGAQVIQAVEDLNAEISQFAACATESCTFTKQGKPRAQALEMLRDSAPWLGSPLIRVLATRDHTQDPIMVQLALQTSIATCCARSLSLFCVGFPSKLDALLSRVLAHLQATEPQATSSRWQSLTHRAIRVLYPGLEEYAVTELVTTMLRWSAAVFAISGSDASSPSTALHSLSSQLRRIAEAAYKLARITREEILSTSFEVVFVESGDAYEDARMTNKMRDYGEGVAGAEEHAAHCPAANGRASRESGRVLCTTELGLRCVTRKDTRTFAAEEVGAGELFESRMLLLPKVVLDSAMEAIERG
ncbi:hypothetical protein BKA93DRAFT_836081 [Sparassis latifolia]